MPHLAVLCALSDLFLSPVASGLDHPSFRERERSMAVLLAWGDLARPSLSRCAAVGSPEARRRAGLLLSRLDRCPWVVVNRMAAGDHVPWINIDGWGSREVQGYLKHAEYDGVGNVMEKDGVSWPAYRHATRLWIRDRIAGGTAPCLILRELERMRAAECAYTHGAAN